MNHTQRQRGTPRRLSRARIAGAVLALSGLAATAVGAEAAAGSTTVVVSTTKNGKWGRILVSGKTLYTLKPSKVACTAQCLALWPALDLPRGVTKAKAGKFVRRAKLSAVKRNGAMQVTYGGKLLYYYVGDKAPGQVTGNITDTWGKWSVVVIGKPKAASSGSGSSGVAF
jgi:predicted lipoprotein with Yx(FWY)xxD motif